PEKIQASRSRQPLACRGSFGIWTSHEKIQLPTSNIQRSAKLQDPDSLSRAEDRLEFGPRMKTSNFQLPTSREAPSFKIQTASRVPRIVWNLDLGSSL